MTKVLETVVQAEGSLLCDRSMHQYGSRVINGASWIALCLRLSLLKPETKYLRSVDKVIGMAVDCSSFIYSGGYIRLWPSASALALYLKSELSDA